MLKIDSQSLKSIENNSSKRFFEISFYGEQRNPFIWHSSCESWFHYVTLFEQHVLHNVVCFIMPLSKNIDRSHLIRHPSKAHTIYDCVSPALSKGTKKKGTLSENNCSLKGTLKWCLIIWLRPRSKFESFSPNIHFFEKL